VNTVDKNKVKGVINQLTEIDIGQILLNININGKNLDVKDPPQVAKKKTKSKPRQPQAAGQTMP
jgi:hypothetical protein